MPIDKTDILDMYDNLKRNYENVKDRWAIKERIREEETQLGDKPDPEQCQDYDDLLVIINYYYDIGFKDALEWVIRDEVDHAIREEN